MKKLLSVLLTTLLLTSGTAFASEAKKAAPKANNGNRITLTKDNSAVLFGVVDGTSVSDVIQQITKLDSTLKSGYPIYLFLYTPGGSIQDGLELAEFIKTVNRPVHTITSFAASMGFQIAQNSGNRYILSTGVLMSHKAAGGFEGEFGDGNSQIDSRYGLWMERIKELDLQTVARTNGKQTLKSYRAAYQNELWLTGAQAIKGGYADRVVEVGCSSELSKPENNRKQTFQIFIFTVHVTFSGCPMNTTPLSVEVDLPTNKGTMSHSEFLKKGGVFMKDLKGKKLDEEGLSGGSSYYSMPDLYCTDPTIGMADINKQLVEIRKEVVARQRRVIKGY